MMDRTRRTGSSRDAAEAAFKSATTKPPIAAATPRVASIPGARELVSLRIDRDVLERFQEGGPGWQERINAVLRDATMRDARPSEESLA